MDTFNRPTSPTANNTQFQHRMSDDEPTAWAAHRRQPGGGRGPALKHGRVK
jgi:hypothetical protein